MTNHKTDNRSTPIEDRKQHIAHAKKLMFSGKSQRQVADLLGYDPKTINQWVEKFGWREKLRKIRKGQHAPAIKVQDSLSTFMMVLKKKDVELYEVLQPMYKKFIR